MKSLTRSLLALTLLIAACDLPPPTSDAKQTQQQETILQEATSAVGMPAIHNFRERRLLKDIYEMRDQDGLVTYTYLFSPMTGKLIFFCDSVGYGIPYATEFTSPQRPARNWETQMQGNLALPQADPNGLFSPASADGTWVMCKNPNGKDIQPMYVEPRIVVSPFKLKE